MTRSIVVGVDETPASQRALWWAAEHAHHNEFHVDAVHVLTPTAEFNRDLSLMGLTTWRADLRDRLQQEWVQPLRNSGVSYQTGLVEENTVEDGLLSTAVRDRAALIVLGAHANGELKDRLLGSVIMKVTHRAECPVVIVPARWNAAGA